MNMKSELADITRQSPSLVDTLREWKEMIVANSVMVSEIPSPTFEEEARIAYISNRFMEAGLLNPSTDELNNCAGIIKGSEDKRNILLVAHADTVFPKSVDHSIQVSQNRIIGSGIADNGLGLGVLLSLPEILDKLNIRLKSNLILLAGTRSLGQGNLEGIRFFLSNSKTPIHFGVCVEGAQLGRLSYASIGMIRGEITCNVPEESEWTRVTDTSAIFTLNEVLNKIIDIPLPRRPRTSIIMGSIKGGHSFNTVATNARLRFEIRSESGEIVKDLRARLEEIVAEVSSQSGIDVRFTEVAHRAPGGIRFTHPLVQATRAIMNSLGIEPILAPSTSELSAFIDANIPAVTLGITKGEHIRETDEMVHIDPIFKGLSQLLGILLAIDRGHCDEH